nr:hypothetical protein [Tanacetum cinerariifolium]
MSSNSLISPTLLSSAAFFISASVSSSASRSSSGIAAAGDPESENASSPAEVGSPG